MVVHTLGIGTERQELDDLAFRPESTGESEFGHEFPEDRLPPIDHWDGKPTERLLKVASTGSPMLAYGPRRSPQRTSASSRS